MAGNRTDAEDIVQEALIRAWSRASSCRGDPLPWLLAITRREAYRRLARRREELIPEAIEELVEPDGLDEIDDRIDFANLLEGLSDDERRLLELRYEQDLTQPAVAKLLGLPEGTTKVRLHRLRIRLRSTWGLADG